MSRKNNLNAFLARIFVCLSGLIVGFLILAPTAYLQDDDDGEIIIANSNMVTTTNANFSSRVRPTPEPPRSIVRGKVFYSDTGKPVKRASIS